MSVYDKNKFCVLRTDPLRTAYRQKKPKYCVPKGEREGVILMHEVGILVYLPLNIFRLCCGQSAA